MTAQLLLVNPKFPHNLGAALRAASCFGAKTLGWTGERISLDTAAGQRLPREERMKAYQDVTIEHVDAVRPLDELPYLPGGTSHLTPVAVELIPGAEPLHQFEHPENAVYVFGPEDGSIPTGIRRVCHRFTVIPSAHCLNLAAATYVVLYDRAVKRWRAGLEPMPELAEDRWHVSAMEGAR